MLEIIYSVVLAKWFELLRRPGEVLSFYDRMLIGMDETNPILYKALTCSFCHSGYISLFFIFNGSDPLILPLSMVLFYTTQKILND